MVEPEEFELGVDRITTGGDGLGVGPDGRVVFVAGALPGDRIGTRIIVEKKRFRRGAVARIITSSPDRRTPPCPYVAEGCGGCDWQHATPAAQRDYRRRIVDDSLRRIGRIHEATVVCGPELSSEGYRTMVRAAVTDGRAGLRAAASHRVIVPESCLISHPLVEQILVEGRFPGATEVVIKVGARTGERLVVVTPSARDVMVPDGVVAIGRDELDGGSQASIHEDVAGRRLRISADAFFQCRPDGAELLVAAVGEMLADAPDGPFLDAYCGGGLFGATVGAERYVVGVESHPASVGDAAVNLPASARVVASSFEAWHAEPMAAVVADPARVGLGPRGVEVIDATGAGHVVLVSCDPASLARDARLLIDTGFALEEVRVFDLFANTSHIEAVSLFRR